MPDFERKMYQPKEAKKPVDRPVDVSVSARAERAPITPPSEVSEFLATPEAMKVRAERRRTLESMSNMLENMADTRISQLGPQFTETERAQVQTFVDKAVALSEQKKDQAITAEDYALQKRNLYLEVNDVLDAVRTRVQAAEEAAIDEEIAAEEKARQAELAEQEEDQVPERTTWIRRTLVPAEEPLPVAEQPIVQAEQKVETAPVTWDSLAGDWIEWAKSQDLYDMNTDYDTPWRRDVSNEDLLRRTGKNQAEFMALTAAMTRKKHQSIEKVRSAA